MLCEYNGTICRNCKLSNMSYPAYDRICTAKVCAKCQGVKALASFPRNKAMAGGHAYWCKDCTNENNSLRSKNARSLATAINAVMGKTDDLSINLRHGIYEVKSGAFTGYGETLTQALERLDELLEDVK